MKRISKSGYCNFVKGECDILVNIPDDSDLESPAREIKISRISCEYASAVRCNPRNCPILKKHNMSF